MAFHISQMDPYLMPPGFLQRRTKSQDHLHSITICQVSNLLSQAMFWSWRHKWLSSHSYHQRANVWWGWLGNSCFKPRCLSQDREMTRGTRSPGQEPLSLLPLEPQAGKGGGNLMSVHQPGEEPGPHWWGPEPWSRKSLTGGENPPTMICPVSGRQLGVEPGTWPPEDGSAPLQNLSPILRRVNQEPGFLSQFCWFLSTSIHMHSKDNSFEGFFLIFIYLAALCLSCGTQDLCSITRGLLLWLRLLCAVLRLQSTWAQ